MELLGDGAAGGWSCWRTEPDGGGRRGDEGPEAHRPAAYRGKGGSAKCLIAGGQTVGMLGINLVKGPA